MQQVKIRDKILSVEEADGSILCEYESCETDKLFSIHGIFGVVEFNKQKYLIVVTKSEKKGQIDSKTVYEVKRSRVMAIGPEAVKHSERKLCIQHIEKFFMQPGIYFSDFEIYKRYREIDTTQAREDKEAEEQEEVSVDRPPETEEKIKEFDRAVKESLDTEELATVLKAIDPKTLLDIENETVFLFNKKAIDNLVASSELEFENSAILKCIHGYFFSFRDFVLISRRSPKRTGARYFSRGLGKHGFPSNFVETEQILAGKSSFLQIRGSIPLEWYHLLDLQYRPRLNVLPSNELFSYSHSLLEQMYRVPIIYLNLIRSTGYEAEIFREFNRHHQQNGKTALFNFDFQKEVYKKEYPFDFTKVGYTSTSKIQKEVIRTNCIDCLDRTNSMQYLIGERIFAQQLEDAQVVNKEEIRRYREALRRAYFENGNAISMQYAGTNAMSSRHITGSMTDEERLESLKRQSRFSRLTNSALFELLRDCKYSLERYFLNRFFHGKHHTVVNIVAGNTVRGELEHNPGGWSMNRLMSLRYLLIFPLFFFCVKKYNLPLKKTIVLVILLFALLYGMSFSFDLPNNELVE